jgi:hypothetical protein
VLAAVFSSQGSYATPQTFVDGVRPAVFLGAVAIAVAALVVLAVPSRRASEADVELGEGSPLPVLAAA